MVGRHTEERLQMAIKADSIVARNVKNMRGYYTSNAVKGGESEDNSDNDLENSMCPLCGLIFNPSNTSVRILPKIKNGRLKKIKGKGRLAKRRNSPCVSLKCKHCNHVTLRPCHQPAKEPKYTKTYRRNNTPVKELFFIEGNSNNSNKTPCMAGTQLAGRSQKTKLETPGNKSTPEVKKISVTHSQSLGETTSSKKRNRKRRGSLLEKMTKQTPKAKPCLMTFLSSV